MIWACYTVGFLMLTLLIAFLFKLVEERRWRRVLRNWDAVSLQSLDVKPLCSRLRQVRASFTNLNRHHARSQRVQRHLTIRRGLLRRAFFHHEDAMADHAISTEAK